MEGGSGRAGFDCSLEAPGGRRAEGTQVSGGCGAEGLGGAGARRFPRRWPRLAEPEVWGRFPSKAAHLLGRFLLSLEG